MKNDSSALEAIIFLTIQLGIIIGYFLVCNQLFLFLTVNVGMHKIFAIFTLMVLCVIATTANDIMSKEIAEYIKSKG